MAGILRSLKRVLSGKIIQRSDVQIMGGLCTMSFRAKSESQGVFVVLAAKSPGNHQYYAFDVNEFDRFVDTAIEIRSFLHAGQTPPA